MDPKVGATPRMSDKHGKRNPLCTLLLLLGRRGSLLGLGSENVGLGIAESGAVNKALLVHLVLHDGGGVQSQDLTQFIADAGEGAVRAVPHADHVLLVAASHHHAHHVGILEGLTNGSEHLLVMLRIRTHKVLPQLAQHARGSLHLQNPATTVRERLPVTPAPHSKPPTQERAAL